MLISQFAEIKWHTSNKKKLIEQGYTFTKMGDIVIVDISNLTPYSTVKINLQCDYCKENFETTYRNYLRGKSEGVSKDCCKNCKSLKCKDAMFLKYGKYNSLQIEEVRDKVSEKRRKSIASVRDLFKECNHRLISKNYINAKTKLKFICKKHPRYIQVTSYGSLKSNRNSCKRCRNEKISIRKKHDRKFVINTFRDSGYSIYDEKNLTYKGSSQRIRVKCINHPDEKVYMSIDSIKAGRKCKFCSYESRRGANNHRWVGGKDIYDDRYRNSEEYKYWRASVLKRDLYTCQSCKEKGVKLNAHHIVNFSSNKDLRYIVENGITFCRSCHKEFHKRYGIKDNNAIQVEEFLNKEYKL